MKETNIVPGLQDIRQMAQMGVNALPRHRFIVMSHMQDCCLTCGLPRHHDAHFSEDENVRALRDHASEKQLVFENGMGGTAKPAFRLIPYHALVALAERFALGEEKYKQRAWNALTDQAVLQDHKWIESRVEHIIHHAYQYLLKMEGIIPEDGDDDAAAIMWGGACLSEARRMRTVVSRSPHSEAAKSEV